MAGQEVVGQPIRHPGLVKNDLFSVGSHRQKIYGFVYQLLCHDIFSSLPETAHRLTYLIILQSHLLIAGLCQKYSHTAINKLAGAAVHIKNRILIGYHRQM